MIKWKRKEKYKGQYNQELEEEELDAIDPIQVLPGTLEEKGGVIKQCQTEAVHEWRFLLHEWRKTVSPHYS